MAASTSPVADSLSRSTTESSSTGTTAREVRTQNEQPNLDPEKQAHDQRYQHPKEKVPHWRLVASQTLITDAVANYPYNGSGTEEDPYVVEFIPNDPRNPMEFSQVKKWFITLTVAIATLAVAFVSSAYSGGADEIIQTFGVSQEVFTLGISLFVLGFAIGPLLWAPLSELYGRQVLFFGTYAVLTVFNAGAAGANSMATLIILRFLAGTFGSSPLTNAGGVIADMFQANQRGLGMSIFAAAPFLGPVIGPIVGGFVGETIGWRWNEGVMACFTGVLWIFGTLTIPETYSPVILQKRAAALSKRNGKVYISVLERRQGKTTPKAAFQKSLARPWALLFLEPIVLLISIYMAIIYGTLYMCFGAFPIVYQQGRGWSPGIGGLAFLGVAVGMLLGVTYSIIDNKRYSRVEDKHDGEAPPEARLPPAMVGSVALPIGLFWFAWTNGPSVHWIVSIIGTAPFGFGMVLVFLGCMNYLIDAYTIYAASVLAANSVLRSIFGAVFPLFTTYMFRRLGIHWASSVPAFLALACTPFPFIFYKYGESIRLKCKYAAQAHEIMVQMRAEQKHVEEEEQEEVPEETTEKDGQAANAGMSRTTTHASRASRPSMGRTSTRASRPDGRGRVEDFGRVYSHASHHHF
ncbi:MFS siderochrome iron transporter 1 [Exophiala xenobiotica]|uniref:MFS siderochrome iron transporter 1 n=1 Tax=Vermiconidia calcicola TaxID=1690605 RepID=A0AAV9PU14_9PEZI|nr:MFS siderochrome iron transporter 1 [Exophiala xenobiotica]KAK5529546.1 MFS siderochrome iron transporter 1 [Vermiconidia calcicola]KAK5529625.1 MFS siderochrome iron transporter 1 [Chaetothyriales sp. CCFEE 6169]KAK5293119.1 MFS siderochrome iron transporter 1 [Exophiala xenobiotica]KAK5337547.1 MFS siderochrome iron transporter 1 [Exophiala xenobiotica]